MEQFSNPAKTNSHPSRADKFNVFLLFFLWFLMALLVNPSGDFPLNDDWVYGRAVKTVLEGGGFTLAGGHSSSNLIAQVYWGALFCLPFGFSFTALRLSTLVLGLSGVLATYGLIREARASQSLALLCALIIALNPVYFGLSNTFMTDVPFFATTMLAFYFFIRGLKNGLTTELLLGIFLSYVTIFIRQLGIIIPIAFACAYLVKNGMSTRNLLKALAAPFLGIILNILFTNWLEWTHRASPILNLKLNNVLDLVFSKNLSLIFRYVSANFLQSILFIGLITFPLVIPLFLSKTKSLPVSEKRVVILVIPVLFTVLAIPLITNHIQVLLGNILENFGLGPLTLHDALILNINVPILPPVFKILWQFFDIVAVFTAAILIYYFFIEPILQISKKNETVTSPWLKVLMIVAIALYYLPLGLYRFFDRYTLPLIPLLMVFVIISMPEDSKFFFRMKIVLPISIIILLVMGIFTISATHDYLSWNRARWQALNNLLAESVSPHYIDGGYEFNGWYLFDPNDTYSINYSTNPENPDHSWWFVDRDDYMITFGPVANYDVLRKYPTGRWLPFSPEFIFTLHRPTAQ